MMSEPVPRWVSVKEMERRLAGTLEVYALQDLLKM